LPGEQTRRDVIDRRRHVRQVGVAGLAERRRDADDDGVDAGKTGEVRRRGERTGLHRRADLLGRHVEDVRLGAPEGVRPFPVDVEADGAEAGPRERDGQRQPHVAEADDADLRLP